MRERKTRIKDIQKLHELIDSASLPKQKTFTPSDNERLENLRKQLSEDSFEEQKAAPARQASSGNLTPQVIVHKKEEVPRKEEKVIEIDLSRREVREEREVGKQKEPEPQLVSFIHVKDDIFSKEPLFEIEKVAVPAQEFIEVKPSTTSEEPQKEFIPVVSVRKDTATYPVMPESGKKQFITRKPSEKTVVDNKEYFSETDQRVKGSKTDIPTFSQVPEEKIPSFEPVEFTERASEKKQMKPLVGELAKEKDGKQKRKEEKQAKRLRKERSKNLKMEELQTEEKIREEHKRKELAMKQAIALAEEKEREEERLAREHKEKTRLENLGVLDRQRQDHKRKKIEAIKAKLDLKEKKREAKRLAKEHDKKLKLEWLEFQQAQRQNQKIKALEEKKAAVKAKEKEQEEQRILKEREEKLRFEQAALARKEKEDQKQKKIEAKKAKLEAKEKQREEKRLAEEQEKKLKLEQLHIEQKQREEEKQKELERKKAAARVAEQQKQEQLLQKQAEEKRRLEQIEKQKEERERKVIKVQKEKKKPLFSSIAAENKTLGQQPEITQTGQKKHDTGVKSVPTQKEGPETQTWESYEEKEVKTEEHPISLFTKRHAPVDTQKSTVKIQKQELKRQKQELKEKERQERLEQKKKLKEQKIQKKVEQEQRSSVISEKMVDAQSLKQKKLQEKLARREAKEKEREAKQLLKEEQQKKEKAFALKEIRIKEKEKEEEKQKEINDKKDRLQISMLGIGKAKETGVVDEKKRAVQQKNTMELVRIAAEEKELRKTRIFERKMEKERKKQERDEQKFKTKENEKAKRSMDLHMREQLIKEKIEEEPDRDDPFVAFDSIDKETAMLLSTVGYTSVEKLRQASVKDLVKIGVKKKNAQRIIAECTEFVEWEVFDATDHF